MSGRSASLRSDRCGPLAAGPTADPAVDEGRWLEHLAGVHSQKPRYFGRWQRTSADLARTLRSLQEIASALSTTTEGADAVARAIALAASHHFRDSWCVISVEGRQVALVPARGGPARASGVPHLAAGLAGSPLAPQGEREVRPRRTRADPRWGVSGAVGSAVAHLGQAVELRTTPLAVVGCEDTETRVIDAADACATGEIAEPVLALAAPLVIGRAVVGSLVLVLAEPTAIDQSDLAVLSILASQGTAALDAARRFEERAQLHRRALEGWAEAARVAEALEERQRELERAHMALDLVTRQQLLDEERHRIAGELHDSVAQHLVSIGMALEWARRASSEPEIIQHLESTQGLARVTLARLRRAIFELTCVTGNVVDVGTALDEVAGEFAGRARVSCSVRGETKDFGAPVAHTVFHVAQEATFNAIHHGEATRVWITVDVGRRVLALTISDDGCGDARVLLEILGSSDTTSSLSDHRHHTGLRSIRRRAEELGGTLAIASRRGGGIRLRFAVPVPSSTRARSQ